jgi:hypothetical protein
VFGDAQAENVGNLSYLVIVKTGKELKKKWCHEIGPNPSKGIAMHDGDNLSF